MPSPRLAFLFVASAGAAHAGSSATFAVTRTPVIAQPVSKRFVGFSIEVDATPNVFLTGGLGGKPRASYAALMNTLKDAGGWAAGPAIRVGGNSADESAWVPAPAPLPANTTYRITDADLDAYAAAVPAWEGSVIIDTTFLYDDPALMLAHTAAAAKRLGKLIESVELGALLLFACASFPSNARLSCSKVRHCRPLLLTLPPLCILLRRQRAGPLF